MGKMTIDEKIAHEKRAAEICMSEYELECSYYGKKFVDNGEKLECVKLAEEHEQLAEWLEDYKRLQGIEQLAENLAIQLTCAREKAIDDFTEELMEQQIIGCMLPDGFRADVVTSLTINTIAEQLKEDLEYEYEQ